MEELVFPEGQESNLPFEKARPPDCPKIAMLKVAEARNRNENAPGRIFDMERYIPRQGIDAALLDPAVGIAEEIALLFSILEISVAAKSR